MQRSSDRPNLLSDHLWSLFEQSSESKGRDSLKDCNHVNGKHLANLGGGGFFTQGRCDHSHEDMKTLTHWILPPRATTNLPTSQKARTHAHVAPSLL